MAQKRFDEYLAKVILESCFPDRYTNLQISDKPDLQFDNKIGVEVTNCTDQHVMESEGILRTYNKRGERGIKRLEQLGELSREDNGVMRLFVPCNEIYSSDIDKSSSRAFLEAVKNKINCLNRKIESYADMLSYDLFVKSDTATIPDFQMDDFFIRLQALNKNKKTYEFIYCLTKDKMLVRFDMKMKTKISLYLSKNMNLLMQKTIQLCCR